MTLLAQVISVLAAHGVQHAVIGAAALAAHGVARATADVDLLTVDPACLDESPWAGMRSAGVVVEIRRGDAADPLAGVVRLAAPGEAVVDLIVGRHRWQRDILERASATRMGDASLSVVRAADLVLLKLYAGGPQDAWDVDQLLDLERSIAPEVEGRLVELPAECAALWRRILAERGRPG